MIRLQGCEAGEAPILSMTFPREFRRQAARSAKLVAGLLTLLLFFLLAAVVTSGYLLYRILVPPAGGQQPKVSQLLGNPSEFEFPVRGESRTGWFYPGRRGGPTVILCHGYRSQRAQILTLAAILQENAYNVFLFDFSGHGSAGGATHFGYAEVAELRAALNTLATRDDIDRERFGLWGADLGAYAALLVAADEPRVRAVVADSVYRRPEVMLNAEVDRAGLAVLPLVHTFSRLGFRLHNWSYRGAPTLTDRLGDLAGRPKLFLRPLDNQLLADETHEVFAAAPEPREQEAVPRAGYVGMMDADKRSYEGRVLSFFLQHLGQ
jgi:pimeloyl-ACP methyl ester carboxylesterase